VQRKERLEGHIADVHRSWRGGRSWNFTTSFLAGAKTNPTPNSG